MPKRLTIRGLDIRFPPTCLVCQQPAEKRYDISRSLYFGGRSMTVTIPVPLCDVHHATASNKSHIEKLVEQLGLILGILAGLVVSAALLIYWFSSKQGNLVTNLLLAAFIGLGAFLIIWSLLTFFVAPLFASPESKAVRGVLKILHFWPASQDVQLEFSSETAAGLVANNNAERLINSE